MCIVMDDEIERARKQCCFVRRDEKKVWKPTAALSVNKYLYFYG